MTRSTLCSIVLAACVGVPLAACNTTGSMTSTSPGYASQSYTPSNFKLPEGRGCTASIARWKAVQQNDYASGNVNPTVYKEIQGDIEKASAACSSGRDNEAIATVTSSRRRHGYPG